MNETEVLDILAETLKSIFDTDDISISKEMTANDVEGWDSFAHIQIIVSLEGEFGIKFTSAEVEGLNNIGEIVDAICSKLS